MMCEDCLKVVNMIDNMNSGDLDLYVEGLHETFEIWLFINMNKFPDKEEFTLIDNFNMDFMLEYYGLAKSVYNIAHDEEASMYEGININNVMLRDLLQPGQSQCPHRSTSPCSCFNSPRAPSTVNLICLAST